MALLSATMLVPATAQAQDSHHGRSDHQQGQRPQQPTPQQQATPQPQARAQSRSPAVGPNGWTGTHGAAHAWQQQQRPTTPNTNNYRPSGDRGSDRGSSNDYRRGDSNSGTRPSYGNDHRDDHRDDQRYDGGRSDDNRYQSRSSSYRSQGRFDNRSAWNRDWRSDSRYDWNRYRTSNRNLYRLPHYYAPRGWSSGYRRFSVGSRLSSILWAQNYWISDPWEYRLPDAYGDYRWVRYYNDALLVDLRTGEVVDEVYDIFY